MAQWQLITDTSPENDARTTILVTDDPGDPNSARLATRSGGEFLDIFGGVPPAEGFGYTLTHWCPIPVDPKE